MTNVFTQELINEIAKKLATKGVRDTQLPSAETPLNGEEIVTVIQDGFNRTLPLSDLITHFKINIDSVDRLIKIGENGNWFINNLDTGFKAVAKDGYTPIKNIDYFDGAEGKIGLTGKQGEIGPTGKDGPVGPRGYTGELGIQGLEGKEGARGLEGPEGKIGLTGAEGRRGSTGEQGIQGKQGLIGLTGPRGLDFKYEDFTEQQLLLLKGATGSRGNTGIGFPIGGAKGQQLMKKSNADYDAEWNTPVGGGDMLKSIYDLDGNGVVDNAEKVGGFTVETNVPANAKFTDTIYTHPASHQYSMITGAPTSLPANGGDSATVNGKTVEENVPVGAKFTDTITTINSKTGVITKADIVALGIPSTDTNTITTINGKTGTILKADIVALGIPAQDTVYTHPTGTNPHGTTKADVGLGNADNTSDVNKPVSTAQLALINLGVSEGKTYVDVISALAIPLTQKGAASGVAELDASGKVLSSQLPSYVDDVLNYTTQSNFPTTGESGKIYITEDTNKTYRWTGSAYVEISSSIALGETSATAYRGDRGKVAYDHSQVVHAPSNAQKNSDITKAEIEAKLTGAITTHTHSAYVPTSRTVAGKALTDNITLAKDDVGLPSVDNTSDINKPVSTAQSTAIGLKVDKVDGKGLSTNDYTTIEQGKLSGIEAGANNYSLPTASTTVIGGVKVGTRVSIASGVLSADLQTANDFTTVLKNKLDGIEAEANKTTLSTSVTSTSTTTAATSSAVKSAYDRGSSGISKADTAQARADSAWTLANGKWTYNASTIQGVKVDNATKADVLEGTINNYVEKLTTTTGAINLNSGNVFHRDATANTTFSITNAKAGAHSFTLIITMGATVRTLTFPASVKWQDGEVPEMTEANKTYILTFVTINSGTTWFGMEGGSF